VCEFIGVADLAANALITLLEDRQDVSPIRFSTLYEYGITVKEQYIRLTGGKDSIALLLSANDTEKMFRNYSDFFKIVSVGGERAVKLKDDKTTTDLRNHFRTFLSLDLLRAFISEEATGVVLQAA